MNEYNEQVSAAIPAGEKIDAFEAHWPRLCVEKWLMGIHDRVIADTILASYRSREEKIKSGKVLPFRRARFPSGPILLGRDLATPFGQSRLINLAKFLFDTLWLIFASPGHGKSVLAGNLAVSLTAAGVVPWLIGVAKDDLLGLLPRFQAVGLDLIVVEVEDLKINPLQAGPNEPRSHLTTILSRLEEVLHDLPPRATLILRTACYELYREFGILDGQRDRWPNLFRAYEKVRTTPNLNVPARDALQHRLGSFLQRQTPRQGAWLRAWDPTDLAGRPMLFLLRKSPDDARQLALEYLLDHVFQHRIEGGVVNRGVDLFVMLDDGQPLVNRLGASGLEDKVRKVRGGGISMALLIQTLQGASPHLLSLVNGWVMGGAIDYDTRMTFARNVGLTPAQIEWGCKQQRRGQFIGFCNAGDWREPFAFETENVPLAHDVTRAEILASQSPLAALPVIPDLEFANWEPNPVVELRSAIASPILSPTEVRLREAIVATPGKPASFYSRQLGMNGKTARAARERLVQLGLVREHRVQLTARGKPSLVLQPWGDPANSTSIPTPS